VQSLVELLAATCNLFLLADVVVFIASTLQVASHSFFEFVVVLLTLVASAISLIPHSTLVIGFKLHNYV